MAATKETRQLVFDLARAPSYDPDDFLTSPSNTAAFVWIERWPNWPHRILLIVGPSGAGKSHLAAIWALRSGARIVRNQDELTEILHQLPNAILLEDGDRSSYREADLFHLLNAVAERGAWLLVTARAAPDQWGLATPDLLSRLRLASQVPLEPPDPVLLRAVIVKLFADRQILIAEDVVAYAALHCEQSLEAINRFVAAVDEEALASGRRITRPLASRLLSQLSNERPALDDERGPS